MGAIIGESIFYDVSRIIRGSGSISYYQYKSLDSFVELITLHDRITLFLGEEADSEYSKAFDWLINTIHEKTDCKIDLVSPKRRGQYITREVMALFEQISREIYSHSLGVTSDDLFTKQVKDRTAEDMSGRIEQLFVNEYPDFDCKKFSEGIYGILEKNANSSELLYFFRAHLFQAIAELQDLTPVYENQRLIAAILQRSCRMENRVGTLPYTIYKMADNLFVKAYGFLPDDKIKYPRVSVLMGAMIERASARNGILDAVVFLRDELEEFRKSYNEAEKTLTDSNKSFYEKSEIQRSLEESVKLIWIPVIESLGRNYTSNKISKLAKGVFGKYGIGEVKLEHEKKQDSSESKATFSTPSLLGIVAAVTQTVSEVYKDSKLIKPNKALLEIILRVAKLTNTKHRLTSLLPVRGFNYRLPKLIDSHSVENLEEVL